MRCMPHADAMPSRDMGEEKTHGYLVDAPCEARLLAMGYRRSELAIVYELLRTGECA